MVAGAPRRMAGRAMVGAMLRQSLSLVPATIGGAYFSSGIGLLFYSLLDFARFKWILFLFLSDPRACDSVREGSNLESKRKAYRLSSLSSLHTHHSQ